MGGRLSKQEELFIFHQWPELLESAMTADGDSLGVGASNVQHTSTNFRMSFYEWQALITLLDNVAPSELPSRLCTNISSVNMLNPTIILMVHACCWLDKSISDGDFERRIALILDNVKLQQDNRGRRRREDDFEEQEFLNVACGIFCDVLGSRKMTEVVSEKSRPYIDDSAFDELASFDFFKKPVVMLAHVFILGVLACVHCRQQYAEVAIQSFRKLQNAINDAASSSQFGGRKGQVAVCNIVEWHVVRRIEGILLRRQLEKDVLDLTTTKDRLWLLPKRAPALHEGVHSVASTEQRWEAVSLQYIGQLHIWEALKTHFLSAGVFNNEKPTVILLFGPSGFGKSEMARRLACVIHGIEPRDAETSGKLVYIHLPSFCTRDSIYSLVDPPAAHVGEGVLISAVRKNQNAVVVLDEFEKCTADAIQNLWLSAFQKKGTLRSLKEASRSVSTEKVTFVLTCNIASDTILRNAKTYLQSTPEKQAAMRAEWTELCKDACRKTMHDPFVNRVDYFFPFVPYTAQEKESFVKMQLSRILLDQRANDRRIYVTPRLVTALANELQTFHAATIEGVVRPLIVKAVSNKWDAAVLTVEERVSGTVFVVFPAKSPADGGVLWSTIPGGEKSLEMCEQSWENAGCAEVVGTMQKKLTGRKQSCSAKNVVSCVTPAEYSQIAASMSVFLTEKERVLDLETTLEKQLQIELKHMKELLLEKEKEIAYLKETVFQLQKVVALLLATTLTCLFVLSLFIGTKLVLFLVFFFFTCFFFLVGMPLQLLLGAIRALYAVLGPFGSFIFVLAASFWISQAVRNATFC